MAMAQARLVAARLRSAYPGLAVELLPVTTAGDRWSGALSRPGDKGAFTKEVDAALLTGEADLAVHCLKDVPADRPLPPGTAFAAFLPREDLRDALVHRGGLTLDELEEAGARVGTSSVRRVAQLAASHPGLRCVPIRGNADRRLEKYDAFECDALILAVCGLRRIGRQERISHILDLEMMCPPLGAGVLVLQCRQDDEETATAAGALNDPAAWREATAERTLLHVLRGHCNSPVAGYASHGADGRLSLRAKVFSPDGRTVLNAHEQAGASDPEALGTAVALALLRQGAREVIDAIPH